MAYNLNDLASGFSSLFAKFTRGPEAINLYSKYAEVISPFTGVNINAITSIVVYYNLAKKRAGDAVSISISLNALQQKSGTTPRPIISGKDALLEEFKHYDLLGKINNYNKAMNDVNRVMPRLKEPVFGNIRDSVISVIALAAKKAEATLESLKQDNDMFKGFTLVPFQAGAQTGSIDTQGAAPVITNNGAAPLKPPTVPPVDNKKLNNRLNRLKGK